MGSEFLGTGNLPGFRVPGSQEPENPKSCAGSCVPKNGEPAFIFRPGCFKARVPMNPEPTVEFAFPGS